jgi:hypothetical protein
VFVEIESNRPNVARLERAFGPHIFACIPRAPLVNSRVKVRMSHDTSPMAGMADQTLGLLSCDGLTPPTFTTFTASARLPNSRHPRVELRCGSCLGQFWPFRFEPI